MRPYFEQDGITVYHGDCREVLPHVGRFDLCLTDPPYGVGLGSHSDSKETRPGVGLKKQGYDGYDDTEQNLVDEIVPAVKMAIAVSERAIVFCAGTMMWHFPRPDAVSVVYLPAGQGRTRWGFQNCAHFMLYGTAPDLNLGAKNTALRSTASADENGHPCPKPLEWIMWAAQLGTKTGPVIDPFLGSGTTLVACKKLGIRGVGIEREEKYCEIAAKRLANTTPNLFSEASA